MSADERGLSPEAQARLDAIRVAFEDLGHFRRLQILMACAIQPEAAATISPEKTKDARPSLGVTAYHMRMLAEAGHLRRTRQVQKRGAVQTFYTASAKGRKLLADLGLDNASA